MKLRTTAALALLTSTLALGGCGDREAPTADPIDYTNYLDAPERHALRVAAAPTTGVTELPDPEGPRTQDPAGYDRHRSPDGGCVFPYDTDGPGAGRTADHRVGEHARTLE